jgi:hypothetical protein
MIGTLRVPKITHIKPKDRKNVPGLWEMDKYQVADTNCVG